MSMVEFATLVVVLVVAGTYGLWRRRTDGRLTTSHVASPVGALGHGALGNPWADDPVGSGPPPAATTLTHDLGQPLGERATLVQFSSAFCAPCRATRQVLSGIAEAVPGVSHIEVDAESHLELVRRLGIRRTPTTLVLDAAGREIRRAAGVPRNDEVLAVLGEVVA